MVDLREGGMNRKIVVFSIITLAIVGACFAYAIVDFPRGQVIYIKAASENLRETPDGKKLGSLDKGTSVIVLEDTPKWVKVRIEGWVWKASVTDSRIALRGDAYRALQIIVKERTEAENILKQLQAGADFKEVAKEKSIGPAAARGGDLGYFTKGDFQPEFEVVILKLEPGEISEIVPSKFGFHIFKRVE
jgi:membrane protein implicated in regulation of membrane protease activity